ncbi:MAG: sigma-70 family RNA polymerase sigma factor [Planctomycetota bacterium]
MTRLSKKDSHSHSGLSLAERLRDGSADAWREMVELYGPLVHKWCQRSGVPLQAIPDVAQEVFFTAFRGLGKFNSKRADATFRGWLWTICRSRIVEHFRKHKGHHLARGGSTAHANLQGIMDPVPVEDPSEADEVSVVMHRALEQIRAEFTTNTWELFWRVTVLAQPTDLVARDAGLTPAAVRQAKSRVLRRLRKQLGDM